MYNKVPQQINDVVGDNVKKLAGLFPSAVKDGEVDFEALKEELGVFTEVGAEKYELTWAGKADAKRTAREDIIGKTLKYIPEDSKDADTTENLYIEGDNLEVLKLLRQNYYGAIKMIYIDPPYNTGNDFVYNDKYLEEKEISDIAEGAANELGEKYMINRESKNRFHANWLNMMYARLKVAKDLLTDDGVIFISIDDNEIDNLLIMCNEIMGEDNLIATFTWRRTDNQPNIGMMARVKEYILCYCKNIKLLEFGKLPLTDKAKNEYRYEDENGKFRRKILLDKTRGRHYYDVVTKSGNVLNGPWMISKEDFQELDKQNGIYWTSGGEEQPYGKLYLDETKGQIPNDFLGIEYGTNQRASLEIEKIFGCRAFDFSKPSSLIETFIKLGSKKDDVVVDFFSGSAVTAQAVMQMNAKEKSNRKFILVQIPEICGEGTIAFKNGYTTICEIGKERIRRAGEKIKSEHPDADIDIGFKVFRVAETNIKWNSLIDMGQIDLKQMETSPDTIDFMPNTKDIDIVYELMLRQRNVPLSLNIEQMFGGVYTYLPLCG